MYRDGVYVVGRKGGKGGKFPPVSYTHPEWIMGTPELWARVDAARTRRTRDMRGHIANAGKHPLTAGVERCECTAGLSLQTDGREGKRVHAYLCSARRRRNACKVAQYRIRKSVLETAIANGLVLWLDRARKLVRKVVHEIEHRLDSQAAPEWAGGRCAARRCHACPAICPAAGRIRNGMS